MPRRVLRGQSRVPFRDTSHPSLPIRPGPVRDRSTVSWSGSTDAGSSSHWSRALSAWEYAQSVGAALAPCPSAKSHSSCSSAFRRDATACDHEMTCGGSKYMAHAKSAFPLPSSTGASLTAITVSAKGTKEESAPPSSVPPPSNTRT
eukprot:854469-Rhodomonas_salina.1